MPIYEYQCNECRHPFETLVRAGEQPDCPKCGSTNLSKQFSVPSAHARGGDGSSDGGANRPAPS